jgi:DNA-binding transcriptional ArsR family regulator
VGAAVALDGTLSALADPTRRRVVELLRRGPHRAGELAARLETSRPAMSRHLRVLRRGGLVASDSPDEDARARVYRLRPERFRELEDWLRDVQGLWTEQLEAFREHVEAAPGAGGPAEGP